MGFKVTLDDWIVVSYETDKAWLFKYAKKYSTWFPKNFCYRQVELYQEGKLKKFLIHEGYWLLNSKKWVTHKTFERQKKARALPEGQMKLFGRDMKQLASYDDRIVDMKERTKMRREMRIRLKKSRDSYAKGKKFIGN